MQKDLNDSKRNMTLKLIRKKLAELQDKILAKQIDVDVALSKKKPITYTKQQKELEKLQEQFNKIADKLRAFSK